MPKNGDRLFDRSATWGTWEMPRDRSVTAWGFVITTFDKMRLKLSLGNRDCLKTGDVAFASFWNLAIVHGYQAFFLTHLPRPDSWVRSDTHDKSAAL